jgi:hypothetical protein
MEVTTVFYGATPRSTVPSQETVTYTMKAHNFTSSANILGSINKG